MTNHVHLVAAPLREDSLGLALHDAHTVCAMCFNGHGGAGGEVPVVQRAFHCGLTVDGLLSEEFPPPGVVGDWSTWLEHEDDAEAVGRIRQQTNTAVPAGLRRLQSGWRDSLGAACALPAAAASREPPHNGNPTGEKSDFSLHGGIGGIIAA